LAGFGAGTHFSMLPSRRILGFAEDAMFRQDGLKEMVWRLEENEEMCAERMGRLLYVFLFHEVHP